MAPTSPARSSTRSSARRRATRPPERWVSASGHTDRFPEMRPGAYGPASSRKCVASCRAVSRYLSNRARSGAASSSRSPGPVCDPLEPPGWVRHSHAGCSRCRARVRNVRRHSAVIVAAAFAGIASSSVTLAWLKPWPADATGEQIGISSTMRCRLSRTSPDAVGSCSKQEVQRSRPGPELDGERHAGAARIPDHAPVDSSGDREVIEIRGSRLGDETDPRKLVRPRCLPPTEP